MKKRSEQIIILKLQSGDRDAYSILYKEYSEALLRFIYFRVTDQELAKDLMQEVFARFIEIVDKEHITNVRAYLYRIAQNLVIDHYKKSDKQPTVSLEQAKDTKAAENKESIEAEIDLNMVIEKMEVLKPLWRDLITLKIINGLEYDEISDIVGKSENYIRVNLHRALKELNRLLEE
jgi:RNA polymerase sigma-70 factor (ECF subfamily)